METKHWVILGIVGVIIAAIVLYYLYFTAPSAPVAGSNSISENSITWGWNPSFNASGYKWSTTNNYATATDIGTSTSAVQSGLNEVSPYSIYVWAYNTHGNSTPTILSATTTSIATPSSGINVATSTSITWNWLPVIGAVGYAYCANGCAYTSATQTSGTTYYQSGLTPSTSYTLYVFAYDSAGQSTPLIMTQLTPAQVCPVPANVTTPQDAWSQNIQCAINQITSSQPWTQAVRNAALQYISTPAYGTVGTHSQGVTSNSVKNSTTISNEIVQDAYAWAVNPKGGGL